MQCDSSQLGLSLSRTSCWVKHYCLYRELLGCRLHLTILVVVGTLLGALTSIMPLVHFVWIWVMCCMHPT